MLNALHELLFFFLSSRFLDMINRGTMFLFSFTVFLWVIIFLVCNFMQAESWLTTRSMGCCKVGRYFSYVVIPLHESRFFLLDA